MTVLAIVIKQCNIPYFLFYLCYFTKINYISTAFTNQNTLKKVLCAQPTLIITKLYYLVLKVRSLL